MKLVGKVSANLAVAAILMLGIQTTAQAAEEPTFFGQTADGHWLVGLKAMNVENNRGGFSDARNIGVVLGYEFARPVGVNGTSTIELEVSDTFDEGGIGIESDIGIPSEWEAKTFGLYFTYKSPGTIYFKGKLGGLKSEIRTRSTAVTTRFTEKDSDGGFSYGLGLGARFDLRDTELNVELEWTGTSGDNDLNIISLDGLVLF